MRRLIAGAAFAAVLLAAAAFQGPASAGKDDKSHTIKLFNGKNLDGWEGYHDYWSVEDGEIVGRNSKPVKYSTYLLTKHKFRDFRLVFSSKLAKSEMHSGVSLWGKVFTMPPRPGKDKGPVDGEAAEAAFQRMAATCTQCHVKFRDVPR